MTEDSTPEQADPTEGGRIANGLFALSYVPLADIEAAVGRALLAALGRARIAAYLDPAPGLDHAQRRLFVAAEERSDARTIVAAAVRALDGPAVEPPARSEDPLAGVDTDAAFAELIADWHVDTVAAVREAERDLRREDADWREQLRKPPVDEPVWLDEDHYTPPPPPPLPRLAAPTIGAMALLAVSILLLGLGGEIGLASDLTMLLGVVGVLLGAGLLVMRLRERPDDDDDDGAVI
ncbi:MAG: hypothetical protein DLM58_07560 [Pseudonocardiales bacterium]|nr:MAG: hypothetical protein DLM58_07560 [Pseudonocardiales bacterium]